MQLEGHACCVSGVLGANMIRRSVDKMKAEFCHAIIIK